MPKKSKKSLTKISESENQRLIKEFLEYKKWEVYRLNNAGIYNPKTGKHYFHGTPGVSDLLCLKKGEPILFIEVKSSIGKVSKHQQKFLDLVNQGEGAIGVMVRGIDNIRDILNNLKAEGKLEPYDNTRKSERKTE